MQIGVGGFFYSRPTYTNQNIPHKMPSSSIVKNINGFQHKERNYTIYIEF